VQRSVAPRVCPPYDPEGGTDQDYCSTCGVVLTRGFSCLWCGATYCCLRCGADHRCTVFEDLRDGDDLEG